MNGRFQIAIHILTLLEQDGDILTSEYMAGSINVNPALIRKEITGLKKAGLIGSKEGTKGGYLLAIPAEQITMAAVYQAVKGKNILGAAKNLPNPDCLVGRQINLHIDQLFDEMDKVLTDKLNNITLAEFSKKFR